jgi:Protein of unknown function (DUF2384)
MRAIFRESTRAYAWIKAPNAAFQGHSALEVMLGGEMADLPSDAISSNRPMDASWAEAQAYQGSGRSPLRTGQKRHPRRAAHTRPAVLRLLIPSENISNSSAVGSNSARRIQQNFAAGPGSRQDGESGTAAELHAGNDQCVVSHVMARIRA